MPPTNEPQVNNVWAQSAPLNQSTSLTLPSGQVCKARRLGMEGILQSGLLGDADSLQAFVGRQHLRQVRGGKGPDGETLNLATIAQDAEALKKIVFLVDRAVPLIVTEPVVHTHFRYLPNGDTEMIPLGDRLEGEVYTDQVGLEDKMFLFQFAVGGSGKLERFRQESAAAVANVSDGDDVPTAAESSTAPARRKRPPRRR